MNVKESGLDTDQQKKSLLKIILKQTNKRKLQENQQMMDKFLYASHLALLFHQLRLQDLAIQVECQTEEKKYWKHKFGPPNIRCVYTVLKTRSVRDRQRHQGKSQNLSSLHAGHFSGWDPAEIDPGKKSESWKAKVKPGRSFGGVGNMMRVFTVEKSQTNATTQWKSLS